MNRHRKSLAGPAILFILMIAGCGHQTSPEKILPKKVKISILPLYSLPLMTERFIPLINYLSEATGYKMEYISTLSYETYLATLESAQVDIGYQNPFIYTILEKTKGAYPLAKAVDFSGNSGQRGTIITHLDSGIKTILGLRGKRVMAVSRKAVSGYLAQGSLCLQNGIHPDKDLTIILTKSQDEVISKVYRQKVDAGFVGENALRGVEDKIDMSKIKIIAYTESFPNWCFAAFAHTDKNVAEKIKEALLKLNKNNPDHYRILEKAELSGFIETSDRDYEMIRETAKILKIPF